MAIPDLARGGLGAVTGLSYASPMVRRRLEIRTAEIRRFAARGIDMVIREG